MVIENIMFFVLGLLAAGLLALLIMPAVWKRAVRLTKKRIEAATPITLAEFRADKDQLRAEFALSTRRLEMNIEALRRRLAEQLRDINRKKSELGNIKGERSTHLAIIGELETREAELRHRVVELEREGAELAQKLRARDREFADKVSELEAATAAGDADTTSELRDAEARIADAENRFNQLLEETNRLVAEGEPKSSLPLAVRLTLEDELEQLKHKVLAVESTLLADWDSDRIDVADLRERMNDVAGEVTRLVYSAEAAPEAEESLFDRVQRFADDGVNVDALPVGRPLPPGKDGGVAERLAALQDIREGK